MPVGVMYHSPSRNRVVCSHRTDSFSTRIDDEAHDERQAAGEEEPRQRRDERLDVEVLHEHADEQADRRAAEDASPGRRRPPGWPAASRSRAQDAGERHDRADGQVDAAGDDDEGHAHGQDQQVGVVEQQRRHVARA